MQSMKRGHTSKHGYQRAHPALPQCIRALHWSRKTPMICCHAHVQSQLLCSGFRVHDISFQYVLALHCPFQRPSRNKAGSHSANGDSCRRRRHASCMQVVSERSIPPGRAHCRAAVTWTGDLRKQPTGHMETTARPSLHHPKEHSIVGSFAPEHANHTAAIIFKHISVGNWRTGAPLPHSETAHGQLQGKPSIGRAPADIADIGPTLNVKVDAWLCI